MEFKIFISQPINQAMFFLYLSINLSDLLAVSSSCAGVRSGGTAPKRVAQVSTYQADPIPIMSDIVLPAYFDYFPQIKVKQPPHKKLRKAQVQNFNNMLPRYFSGFETDWEIQWCGSGSGSGSVCCCTSRTRIRHYLYGSRSGSGSFHIMQKYLKKLWFLLFCDVFMTFYLWRMV